MENYGPTWSGPWWGNRQSVTFHQSIKSDKKDQLVMSGFWDVT